jgi:hypothetical protein
MVRFLLSIEIDRKNFFARCSRVFDFFLSDHAISLAHRSIERIFIDVRARVVVLLALLSAHSQLSAPPD